jgi:ketosteroid isomerase-like protein
VEARERTLHAIYDALGRRDAAGIARLVAPDFEFYSSTGPRLGKTPPYRGRDGMIEYMGDVDELWTEFRVILNTLEHAGAASLGVGRVWARNPRILIDSPCSWIWEFTGSGEDGELPVRCRVFEDELEGRREFEGRRSSGGGTTPA